jgi:RNA polymerase sigma factor (sigma-70 family)
MGLVAEDEAGAAMELRVGSPRLTAAQEHALLRTVRHAGCVQARHHAVSALWRAHGGLVAAVASRYRRTGIDTEDLISAGQLGLHAAIVRFDPDRFAGRLSTYAVPWIRWYVQDHVSRNALPVRLPATTAHRHLARFAARLLADARRACLRERVEPTESELYTRVGCRIGLSADEVARGLRAGASPLVNLDAQTDRSPDAPSDPDTRLTPEDAAIARLDHNKLRCRILALTDTILGQREREVFLARCMTGDAPVIQLDALAERFAVSRERIYQLESSARRKIMTALRQEGFAGLPDRNLRDQGLSHAQARSASAPAARVRSR